MTLKELIKTAAGEQLGKPNQPVWQGNTKMPEQQKVNAYGWTNSVYTMPGANASAAEKQAWSNTMRADLMRQNPNFDFNDPQQRWQWDWDAANEFINGYRERTNGKSGFSWMPSFQNDQSKWAINPLRWITFYKDPYEQQHSQANSNHPVIFNAQRSQVQGAQQDIKQDIADISGKSVVAASWSPYFMPEVMDYLSDGSFGNWQNARDVNMLRQEYADALRDAGYTPDQIAQMQNDLGYITNGDTVFGRSARVVQDMARDWLFRGSLVNLATAGTVGGLSKVVTASKPVQALTGWAGHVAQHKGMLGATLRFGTKAGRFIKAPFGNPTPGAGFVSNATKTGLNGLVGFIRNTVAGGVPAAAGTYGINALAHYGENNDGTVHDILMTIGLNRQRMQSAQNNTIYGSGAEEENDYGRAIAYTDNGEKVWIPVEGGGYEPVLLYDKDGNISQDLNDYQLYQTWAEKSNLDPNDLETQKKYVQWYTRNGTMDSTIVLTPMFRSMSSDDQVACMNNMLKNRKLWSTKAGVTIGEVLSGDSRADMFANALRNDKDGSMHKMFQDFLMGTDSETFAKFLGANAGSGSSAAKSVNTDLIYKELENGIVGRIVNNPNEAPGTISALLKLKMAENSGNIDMNSQGAQVVKKALMTALADKDTIRDMDPNKRMELTAMLYRLSKTPGGMESLGDDGLAMAKQIEDNLQENLWETVWSDPIHNLPLVFSMMTSAAGFDGISEAASNPWTFWLGAAALLACGLLVGGSGLDDDDEDDEEDNEYEAGLRRNPYA